MRCFGSTWFVLFSLGVTSCSSSDGDDPVGGSDDTAPDASTTAPSSGGSGSDDEAEGSDTGVDTEPQTQAPSSASDAPTEDLEAPSDGSEDGPDASTPTATEPSDPDVPDSRVTDPDPSNPTPTEAGATDAEPGSPEGAYVACSGAPVPALQFTEVLTELDRPIHAVTPNGDASTLFVAERGGRLLRFDLSQPNPEPVEILSVTTVTNAECGFLSVALHPNFDGVNERRLYVSYNPACPSQGGGSSALDEYLVTGDGATFERSLFSVMQPQNNHNGGLVTFGPDGYLYFGLGDGGGSNDQHGANGNGQDVNVPLGKILRFDVDDVDTPPAGNVTSADVGGVSVDGRVLHYGLRNPWRFSFDRETDDLYIGDVGQNTWEEISFAPAGAGPLNFGWAAREGFVACPTCSGKTLLPGSTATDPILSYPRGSGGSVTGGFVYRGRAIPGLWGRYLYGDYAQGTLSALTYDGAGGVCDEVEELLPNLPGQSLASFAEDANGEIYVVNISRGTISRIDPE